MRGWLSSPRLWIGLAAAALAIAFLVNPSDRLERLARGSSVLVSPQYVFIGDSLTKSGGLWGWRLNRNPLAAINLAQNGADTATIAVQAKRAATYKPRRIVVMAGTNDAAHPVDATALRDTWRRLFAAAAPVPVIVFLPPRTARPFLNDNLRDMDGVIRAAAAEAGACLADLNDTLAPAGTLEADYTYDGLHFTEKAYAVWVARIAEVAKRCGR